jgi:amino acid transporter
VLLSTLLIGALYIFTTYAATVAYGPARFSSFASYANGVPWDGLARTISVVFWALVLFAIINSTLANANAGANVFTRTAYAFGRVGAFPRMLADLHPRFKSPRVGILVELILSLALGLALGFKYTPQVAFGILGTAIVVIVVPVYIACNIACIGYFARHRKEEQHFLSHIVVPIIGALLLIPGFFSVAGITGIPGLRFIAALTSPYKYAPYAMAAWLVVGIVALLVLRSRNPQAIDKVAHVYLEDEGM